jgi:hypothetical protein
MEYPDCQLDELARNASRGQAIEVTDGYDFRMRRQATVCPYGCR